MAKRKTKTKTTTRRRRSPVATKKKRRTRRKSMGEGLAEKFSLTKPESGTRHLMSALVGVGIALVVDAVPMDAKLKKGIFIVGTLAAIAGGQKGAAAGFAATALVLEIKNLKNPAPLADGNGNFLNEKYLLSEEYLEEQYLSEPAIITADGRRLPVGVDLYGNMVQL